MEIDNGKESTIELLGAAGFFVSAGAMIQAFMMVRFSWVLLAVLLVYAWVFSSYMLLYKMKSFSLVALLISGGLLFLLQVLFLLAGGFLWLSVALTLFTWVVIALVYIQELHHYIRRVNLYLHSPLSE